jgi:hypothetical protein
MNSNEINYTRVLAIDVGYRNFAWCVVDSSHWKAPLRLQHEDWWGKKRKKPTRQKLMDLCDDWCNRNAGELKAATWIVLEHQIQKIFIAMNAFLASKYWHKTRIVSPMTLCGVFDLPRSREEKKAATVALARHNGVVFPDARKDDDLADAWLMCMWQMNQIKNSLFT